MSFGSLSRAAVHSHYNELHLHVVICEDIELEDVKRHSKYAAPVVACCHCAVRERSDRDVMAVAVADWLVW